MQPISHARCDNAAEIEPAIIEFARHSNSGLVIVSDAFVRRRIASRIIGLAARHRVPAVYGARYFATAGGLISYGPDFVDQYRRAAGYVDRISRAQARDLPVRRRPSSNW